MKLARRSPFLAVSLIGLTIWAAISVDAATATVTLLPGRLTITSTPSTVNFTASSTSGETQTFAARFAIGVTDATGSKAGWNINAKFVTIARTDGIPLPVLQSSVTSADVTPETGIAPISLLTYPRPFLTTGDTIFSAAPASGMGKSQLVFGAELVIPADIIDSSPFATALIVTVASGP